MLPLTAGCTLRFHLSSTTEIPRLAFLQTAKLTFSGIFLMFMGFMMNLFAGGWSVIMAWNVLQTVGLSFIAIAAILSLAPAKFLALVGAGCMTLYPWLDHLRPAGGESYFIQVIFGDPSGFHSWPFIPWFLIVLAGFFLSHAYIYFSDPCRFRQMLIAAAAAFMLPPMLLRQWMPVLDPSNLMGAKMFSPPWPVILALPGFSALIFLVAGQLEKLVHLSTRSLINCFSKGILWIYFVHLVVGNRLYVFLKENSAGGDWVNSLSGPGKIAAIIALPTFMMLLSWLTGYLCIRLLYEKRFRIELKKCDNL
jgi:hypothetical protein